MVMERYEKKFKRLLSEMAFSKSQIESEIRSSNRNRTQHLLKCFYMPENTSYSHWLQEIYTDLDDIQQMKWKRRNKHFSKERYFENLWEMPFENKDDYEIIDSYVEDLIYQNYKIPEDWKLKKNIFIKNLKHFYWEISELFSLNKLSRMVVYDLIKRHFK